MGHKSWLRLLLLFLGFSFVLSSASGSLKAIEEDPSAQYLLAQGTMDMKTDRELLGGFIDVEDTDYPGTGANNHHDPKTPGRV
ncbi:hypothetical protein F0562_017248 [Nyssa sinensis]|uniref:Uncharacterized protein n=1 Tax=Nyssa sinensis TaxID=561372 RepID=A0A5J4ZGG7_9ASTE|nr:hypothetical protein F0562_017248 [Nyssa sinensis]